MRRAGTIHIRRRELQRSETDGGPGQLENSAEAPLVEWKLGVIVSEKQKSG